MRLRHLRHGLNRLGLTTVTPGPDRDFEPSWSPDGQKIMLVSEKGLNAAQLYRANPDGSEQTYVPGGGGDPAWAPDSITVAYAAESGGCPCVDIFKTSDDKGDTITRLTNASPQNAELNKDPDWSPDGQKIVFDSARGSADYDIFAMNADGTAQTRLTTDPARDIEPSWQPVPPGAFQPGYPRPKGATPLQAYLALAYGQCTSPDRMHGPPLAGPSCSAPAQASNYLTVGTLDANGQPAKFIGSVRLDVRPGNPATPQNEADVALHAKLTDVRCRAASNPCPNGALSDYQGSLDGTFDVRITDKFNTGPHPEPATLPDLVTTTSPLHAAIPCSATADTSVGSTCELTTTLNAVLPSVIREGKRAIWALGPIQVKDGGDDGNGATADDNTPFAVEGIFVP